MASQLTTSYRKTNIAKEKKNYRFTIVITALKLASLASNCQKRRNFVSVSKKITS